jgi:molecular chaperone GrpE (heat shock protein)
MTLQEKVEVLKQEKKAAKETVKKKSQEIKNTKKRNDRLCAAAKKLSPEQLLALAGQLTAAAQSAQADA